MAFLAKGKKEDLLELADELGETLSPTCKVVEIRKLILESKHFNEEEVKCSLDRIIEDRKAKEDRIIEDKRQREEREYALEIKRLELSSKPVGELHHAVGESSRKIQLIQIMPKFDEKRDEMSLYLINFERRAEIADVPRENWVAYLLSVLPTEISNMMAREPTEQAKDYDYVKELILRRYKLNAEKLKQLFYRHQKTSENTWKNYAYELSSYFQEWIDELGIKNFEQLKALMVAEQIKRRVPNEVKEHFLDEWMKLISPSEIAEKIDGYESLRESFKSKRIFVPKVKNETKWQSNPKIENRDSRFQPAAKQETAKEKMQENNFERRRKLQCYECGSYNHLRPQCPSLKNRNFETVAANDTCSERDNLMAPYMSIGRVNGIEMPILRDTGASLDLVCNKFIKPHMYTGEQVWIKTPLEESLICLPLAEVELECYSSHLITKAAVLRDSLDQGRYLLGNKTALLMEEMKNNTELQNHVINAVQTRAQKKLSETLSKSEDSSREKEELQTNLGGNIKRIEGRSQEIDEADKWDEILPLTDEYPICTDLLKMNSQKFINEQKQSDDLAPLFEDANRTSKKNKYTVDNQILFYVRKDNDGSSRKLLSTRTVS